MNTYEKMTLAGFKKKLEAGGYKEIGGARKAVGRSRDLSAADKEKARKIVDAYFGDSKPSKPAKTAKKPAAKKEAKVVKTKAAKQAKSKVETRTPVTDSRQLPLFEKMSAEQIKRSPAAAAGLAGSVIGSISDAIRAMKEAKVLVNAEVESDIKAGVRTLGKAIGIIERNVVTPLSDKKNGQAELSEDEVKAVEALRQVTATDPAYVAQD